jgi:hypothetical protein
MIFCQKQESKNNQGHIKTGAMNDVMKRGMAGSIPRGGGCADPGQRLA